MSWFDLVLAMPFVGIVWYESKQEAGRALLDSVATLGAAHFSITLAPLVGQATGLVEAPYPASPWVHIVLFSLLWALGLIGSRWVHQQTRWSVDALDPLVGVVLGMVMVVTAGHAITQPMLSLAATPQGELPTFLARSVVADELCNFRSYAYLLDLLESYQRGGSFAQ